MKVTETKIKRTTKVKTLQELSDMEVLANVLRNEKDRLVKKCKYEEAAKYREQQMDVLISLKKDLTVKLADVVRIIGNYKKPRAVTSKEWAISGGIDGYISQVSKMVDKLKVDSAGWSRTLPVEPKKAKKSYKPKK